MTQQRDSNLIYFDHSLTSVIPGVLLLSDVKVEVGPYNTRYQTCGNRNFHGHRNATNVTCSHSLKGYSVKITVIGIGEMEICKVAAYGSYGKFTMKLYHV